MRPRILIIADWYLPGYKAGGLVTALANLAEAVGGSFELYVFTRDRDLTDARRYAGIRPATWETVGKARVFYTDNLSFRELRRIVFDVAPELIYLNSFFSTLAVKILCLRKAGMLPECATVLAPRGEFSPGALQVKRLKKTIFANWALRAGLYGGLVWHASSDLERDEIAAALGGAGQGDARIHIAWDLPSPDWLQAASAPPRQRKTAGARFAFVSRISPKKNLLFALEMLGTLQGRVEFDVFGPVDDEGYGRACRDRIASLGANVAVRFRGTIPRNRVAALMPDYDFFLLPTSGENFGYAILEAMAAGCPAIVSDRTPWRDLAQAGSGWALPLENRQAWHQVLQQCVDMGPEEHGRLSTGAREYVQKWATSTKGRGETIELFNSALEGLSHAGRAHPLPAMKGLPD